MQRNGWGGKMFSTANGIHSGRKSFIITGQTQCNTMTLLKQTSLFTEDQLTSSQEDSHVSHTAQPERDSAKRMNATFGQKCLEQFGRFNHVGSWAKMYAGLLVGMEGWYSTRCKLTWKLKASKLSRFYFQLAVSTPPTAGIESGLLPTVQAIDGSGDGRELRMKKDCKRDPNKMGNWRGDLKDFAAMGLLLTPTTREEVMDLDKFKERMEKYPNGTTMPNLATQVRGMLATPNARDWKGASGHPGQKDLNRDVEKMMLPTPAASNYKGGCIRTEPERQNDTLAHAIHGLTGGQHGTTSQLNPRFVAGMMGFPPNWLELPFQSTDKNQ